MIETTSKLHPVTHTTCHGAFKAMNKTTNIRLQAVYRLSMHTTAAIHRILPTNQRVGLEERSHNSSQLTSPQTKSNSMYRYTCSAARRLDDTSTQSLMLKLLFKRKQTRFLGPFHGARAVPSVTRCRCRRCRGHRCAGGARQYR